MDIVSSIINYLRCERGYWLTRNRLHQLDDRILQDIGLRRDQINPLALKLRDEARAQNAADAQNKRNEKARKRGLRGGGFAAQH